MNLLSAENVAEVNSRIILLNTDDVQDTAQNVTVHLGCTVTCERFHEPRYPLEVMSYNLAQKHALNSFI